MLATPTSTLPVGPDWTYEVKWDGYRVIAEKDGTRVRLISRNGKDLTRSYPGVVKAVASIRPSHVVLDGELVAIGPDGRPSFQALQHRTDLTVVYYAFDLLVLNHESWIDRPLDDRRKRLATVVAKSSVLLSEPLPGSVDQIERAVRQLGLEGVVAKRRASRYRPGARTDDWLKVKFSPRQEFVVGGLKPADPTFDSLLVGYYTADGSLLFAAKVRAGFAPRLKREISRRLGSRRLRRCPFANLPNSVGRSRWGAGVTAEDMMSLRWVPPRLVVEVAFVEWTQDGLLRHPAFVGVREDKPARDVRREPRTIPPAITRRW